MNTYIVSQHTRTKMTTRDTIAELIGSVTVGVLAECDPILMHYRTVYSLQEALAAETPEAHPHRPQIHKLLRDIKTQLHTMVLLCNNLINITNEVMEEFPDDNK